MKLIEKILTILAVLLIVLTTVSMAAGENLTLTVTGAVGGRTFAVYKLFDLEIKDGNYYYTWNDTTKDFFSKYDTDTSTEGVQAIETELEATEYVRDLDTTSLTKLAEAYYKYCQENGVQVTATQTVTDTKATSVSFTGLDQGYYLVYDETTPTAGTQRSAAMLSSCLIKSDDANQITLKAENIEVDKKANTTEDSTTASVNDVIPFTVETKVPNMVGYDSYVFEVTDTLSKGLDLVLDETTTNPVVTITIDGQAYTNFAATYTNRVLTIKLGNYVEGKDARDFLDQVANQGKEIVISYSAKVNADAVTEDVTTNNVVIEYSNDPNSTSTGTTPSDIVRVYTYAIDFTKIASDTTPLEGAKFVLKLSDGTYATFDANLVYTGSVESQDEATVLTSGADGKVSISGLKAGSYSLIETEAPSGYNKPNFDFNFTIDQTFNADGTLNTATFDYTTDETNATAKGYIADTTNTSASFAVKVLNARTNLLPETGGIGTTIFTVVGISLMVVAAVVFVIRNKKENE